MLTPIELRNRQWKTGRGYSKKEADEFLEELYSDYEKLYKQNLELKDKIGVLSEGVQYYKSIETTLQKALVLAEKTAKETCDTAKAKAQGMEQEAEQKAQAILQEAKQSAQETERGLREKWDEILKEARQNAENLEREALQNLESARKTAKDETERMTAFARKEWEETRKKCIAMVQQYNSFKSQFKKLMTSQLDMLKEDYFEIYTTNLKTLLSESFDDSQLQSLDAEPEEELDSFGLEDKEESESVDAVLEEGSASYDEVMEEEPEPLVLPGGEEPEVFVAAVEDEVEALEEMDELEDLEAVEELNQLEDGEDDQFHFPTNIEVAQVEEEEEEATMEDEFESSFRVYGDDLETLEEGEEGESVQDGEADLLGQERDEDADAGALQAQEQEQLDEVVRPEPATQSGADALEALLRELRNDLSNKEEVREEEGGFEFLSSEE